MRKVTAYRRPLLDLTQTEMLLIAASLLSLRMPPGVGILTVIIIGLVHWHMKKDASAPTRELLHAHRDTDDPTIRQQLAIYKQAWIAEQKGELSEDQRKEWYSVGGFLLLTIPKPYLPLHHLRLDIAFLFGALSFHVYQLYVLFPAVMDALFFRR